MLKTYEYRIYPTQEQEVLFLKANGLCRLYWNTLLGKKRQDHSYKIVSAKQVFTDLKPEALEWCKEIDSTILAAEWNNISSAFNNFFKSCRGERKLRVGEPQFKSKKTEKVSISFTSQNKPKIQKNGYLFLTRKIGPIKGVFHRWAYGDFRHATISQTKTGKWFVKICVDKKDEPKNNNGKSIGIDWNCRDDAFITMSNGMKVKCPRYLRKMQKQLKHQQKDLSRKKYASFFQKYGRMPDFKNPSDCVKFKEIPVSNNYEKQKYKVALLHEKVANQRKDWLHKLSREICNEYETVVVENINLQNMASNLHHGKVISDQGFGMFRQMIAHKGHLEKVSPRNTSKMCHCCGFVNQKVVVGVDEWDCPNCGSHHDRDINAALNILHKWNETSQGIVGRELAEITNACGAPSSAMKQEVSVTGQRLSTEASRSLAD